MAAFRRGLAALFPRPAPSGLVGALLFYCWSLTPSLLPRPWYLQGVAAGLGVATGYGIGVLVAWLLRRSGLVVAWPERVRQVGWWLLTGTAVVLVPTFLVLGSRWQDITRELVGLEPGSGWDYPGVFGVAVVVATILVSLGRLLRGASRVLYRRVRRVLPAPLARIASVVVLAVLLVWIARGLLSTEISRIANGSAAVVDQGTPDGVVPPSAPERSGSEASLEPWDSLGREGRTFVAGGPDRRTIEEVTGREAVATPIRVYAGYRSVEDEGYPTTDEAMDALAQRVVAELDRTGGFERRYLAVATTTGRGWVNQDVADSLEYLAAGDSAIAAIQYSYLASPLAFLADRVTPRIAGRALFEAVYARWEQLPEGDRPVLLTFGESLGSYGGQSAFSGLQDMLARVDGALWVGTPNFTEQWRRVTASRDPGSTEILPVVYGGRNARFASWPDNLYAPDLLPQWDDSRIVYWQHASDPIVWWSFRLLFDKPDWLKEPRGADVDPSITWMPFVTFWQVTLDMVFAADVPYGHGHAYGPEAVYFWDGILGIDDRALSDRIHRILDGDPTG